VYDPPARRGPDTDTGKVRARELNPQPRMRSKGLGSRSGRAWVCSCKRRIETRLRVGR
jgi:hypothetical protein